MEMDQGYTLLTECEVATPRAPDAAFRRIELAVGRKGFLYRGVVRESWGRYQADGQAVEEGSLRVTSTDSDWSLALIGVRDKAAPRKIGADPEAAEHLKAALTECEARLRVLTGR